MTKLEKHISDISGCIDSWLTPDNIELKTAIERTVDEDLFSFEDIRFQILALKHTLKKKHLDNWVLKANLRYNSLTGLSILCLHAGNLPLVGIQDALAVILAGGNYVGKISRKDPYLLPTLLKKFIESDVHKNLEWNTDIHQLKNTKADALIFAGSVNSAADVEKLLMNLNIISMQTPRLMRTAHFSVALIEDNSPETMRDLTEAVFRYGGAGCRSVAIVAAPFHLNAEKCSFTDYVEEFWLRNPQHKKPKESLFHRFAFNKSMNIEQAWLNDFLVEEHLTKPGEKFVLNWVKGGKEELDKITGKFANGIQSVYSTKKYIGKQSGDFIIEPLSTAQTPPVWWKPDQVDTLQWLRKSQDKTDQ